MFLLPDWMFDSIVVLIWLVLSVVVISWYEPRLIYYPRHPTRALESTPDKSGFQYEDVHLTTADQVRIHGWFLASSADGPLSGFTLLFFHGNAGNISHRLTKCRTFVDLGMAVLVIDYRGYGQSQGRPTELGTYRDADAAYRYLLEIRGLSAEKIVVYGESLGSAIAVDLVSRVPVKGLILEAPFTSVPDVAKLLFKGLPLGRLARHRYDSLSKISQIHAPLLLLHSCQDEFFPLSYSQRLLTQATGRKKLVELKGSHADGFFESLPLVTSALDEFLAGL